MVDGRNSRFLISALLLVSAIALFPPCGRLRTYGRVEFNGFRPIWEPRGPIDFGTLFLELVIAIAVTGVLYLVTAGASMEYLKSIFRHVLMPSFATVIGFGLFAGAYSIQKAHVLNIALRERSEYSTWNLAWDKTIQDLNIAVNDQERKDSQRTHSQDILGKLGQTISEAPIRSSMESESRIYYKTKKFQYLVINETASADWLSVLLQNGKNGYIRSSDVARLPYDVRKKGIAPQSEDLADLPQGTIPGAEILKTSNGLSTLKKKYEDSLKDRQIEMNNRFPLGEPKSPGEVGKSFDASWMPLLGALATVAIVIIIFILKAGLKRIRQLPEESSQNSL